MSEHRTPTSSAPLVVGVAELARLLGLSRETVRQALLRGEIPHTRIGRQYFVARDVLDDLIHGRHVSDGSK